MTVKSDYSVAETVSRIKQDVAKKGIMFFGVIDQAEARQCRRQRGAGRRGWSCSAIRRSARPSSPPIPKAGLDWPVRVLVYQAADGGVYAAYTDFDWIAKRHGIEQPRQGIQDGDGGHPVGSSRGEEVRFTKERAGICDGDIRRLGGREDRSRSILEHFR